MNKVKLDFNNDNEFDIVKNNILYMMKNDEILKKYDISYDSVLNDTNNKLTIAFKDTCIYIYFNHYYISGSAMFILLNKIVNSNPPKFLQTNPFIGIINLPFYIYDLMLLKKKKYDKNSIKQEHLIVENKIITLNINKRYYLYLNILSKIYNSLQLNRPLTVALSIAFDALPYINNNVGLIIINYEITDTIEILEKKIKMASYQAYCSNFIINCPLQNIGNIELRDYIDCVISSMYIKSDYDFKIGWNCCKLPIEQIYVGSVSKVHSDNTMDINMVFTSCSSNYNYPSKKIDNFFA
jgi:hypothetical protein